jgi:prophage regulatory protein
MKLLGIDELKPIKGVPYSKPHLWRLIRAGKFPRPIRLGQNRIAFPESEIDDWVRSKIVERDEEGMGARP